MPNECREYVTFYLNNEAFAAPALSVQEIIELTNITKVPHLPEFIKGVINLRGTIIPVIDLKQKFGMNSEEYKAHACIIVTEFSGGVTGLIVDSVSDVLNMPQESIKPAPSFGTKVRADFINGVAKVDEKLVIVLDVEMVLSNEEAAIAAEAAASSI
ncbi:MAG: purine-binding chemotaxis protein CheW [Deltaproteobacteria bacterium]|nr:purine-binding chemotaxis protein CheW [Deltaproteobacteria bacterium]